MNSIAFEYTSSHGQMLKNHFHDSLEIYYLNKGQRYYFIKNNTHLVLRGDLVLIKENLLHKTFAAGIKEYERYLLNINRNYMQSCIKGFAVNDLFKAFDDEIFVLINTDNTGIESIFRKMHIENLDTRKDEKSRLKLFTLTIELLLAISSAAGKQKHTQPVTLINRRILEITEYINAHYNEQISLEELAKTFNISRFYLCKLFKNAIGFTFTEFLNNVRIKEAKALLLGSSLNVTRIAEKVGYSDTTYFCRTFKKIIGVSALAYRKNAVIF